MKTRTERQLLWLIGVIPVVYLLTFYVLPLGVVFQRAAQALEGSLLQDGLLRKIAEPLGFTIFQATLSTLCTILVGFPIAYVFSHFEFKGKTFFRTVVTLPFILPTVVVAAAFNSLIGNRGWFNLLFMQIFNLSEPPIQLMNTLAVILLAHVFYNTSVFVRVVGAAWSQLDVEKEEVASVLGANKWQRFRYITFPLLRSSIFAALLMVFLFDFTSFGVILLLGGPAFSTMEVEIYLQTTQMLNLPLAGILSVVQMIATLFISVLSMRESGSRTVSFLPDIKNDRLQKVDKPWQKIFLVGMIILVVFFFVLPEIGLFLRSIVKLEAARTEVGTVTTGFTLDFYKGLFQNPNRSLFYVPPIQALKNSVLYAISTTVLACLMGVIAAYNLARARSSKVFRALLVLPLGTSSVTLGLGFLLVFTRVRFFQQFPQILIPIAHALVALPVVVSSLYPAFKSIPLNIRDAARNLGASPITTLREIDLKLVKQPLVVSALYAFILSLGEFGATSFLTRPEYPTMPIAIYRYLGLPGAMNYGQAMAMACILLVVCAISMLIIERLVSREDVR